MTRSITKSSLKINYLEFHSSRPGPNELIVPLWDVMKNTFLQYKYIMYAKDQYIVTEVKLADGHISSTHYPDKYRSLTFREL